MVLTVDEILKGKPPFKKLAVNLTGDADSRKKKETPSLLKRAGAEAAADPLRPPERQGLHRVCLQQWHLVPDGRRPRRRRRRCTSPAVHALRAVPAPHLFGNHRRTEAGRRGRTIRQEGAADPNQKEKAGIGPEVESSNQPTDKDKKESFRPNLAGGPVFGVIPMLVVGPLALWRCCFRRCSAA